MWHLRQDWQGELSGTWYFFPRKLYIDQAVQKHLHSHTAARVQGGKGFSQCPWKGYVEVFVGAAEPCRIHLFFRHLRAGHEGAFHEFGFTAHEMDYSSDVVQHSWSCSQLQMPPSPLQPYIQYTDTYSRWVHRGLVLGQPFWHFAMQWIKRCDQTNEGRMHVDAIHSEHFGIFHCQRGRMLDPIHSMRRHTAKICKACYRLVKLWYAPNRFCKWHFKGWQLPPTFIDLQSFHACFCGSCSGRSHVVTFGECLASLKLPRCTSLPCALTGILISSDFKGVCFFVVILMILHILY